MTRFTVVLSVDGKVINDTFDADSYKLDPSNNLMFYRTGLMSPIVTINHKYWQVVQEERNK